MTTRSDFILKKRGKNWNFTKGSTHGDMGAMVTSERIPPGRLGCIIMFLSGMTFISHLEWIPQTIKRVKC